MKRPGRNDPCHCGSGKKYKKCCLTHEEAEAHAARRVVQEAAMAEAEQRKAETRERGRAFLEVLKGDEEFEEYIRQSNHVLSLIHAGRLDEGEEKARELARTYPDWGDGIEHLGFVCEKRGQLDRAAQHYREAAEMGRIDGELSEHSEWLIELADQLCPAKPGAADA